MLPRPESAVQNRVRRALPTCSQRRPPEARGNVVVPAEVVAVREEEETQSPELEDRTVVPRTGGGHHVATSAQNQALQLRASGEDHVDVHLLNNLNT